MYCLSTRVTPNLSVRPLAARLFLNSQQRLEAEKNRYDNELSVNLKAQDELLVFIHGSNKGYCFQRVRSSS